MEEIAFGIIVALLLEMRSKLQSNSKRIFILENKVEAHLASLSAHYKVLNRA